MLKWIERFETWINWAVLAMMALVVLMLAVGFAIDIARDLIAYPTGSITSDQVFAIFGNLLLILIGLELMHTVHVEVILAVALVALARKVIVFNLKDYQGTVVGLALLIAALAGSHWLLLRKSPPR